MYLHGVPTSSDDWTALLERTGGIAPDLLGFGRSGKGGHLDYSLGGLTAFCEAFLEAIGFGTTFILTPRERIWKLWSEDPGLRRIVQPSVSVVHGGGMIGLTGRF